MPHTHADGTVTDATALPAPEPADQLAADEPADVADPEPAPAAAAAPARRRRRGGKGRAS